ncbi:MAG: ABC transporter substrate-binding protein [Gammaproteobacteria bacterium]|nr:ABC transporter substrate-binding protein [Gammaproteobacteria bacterium]
MLVTCYARIVSTRYQLSLRLPCLIAALFLNLTPLKAEDAFPIKIGVIAFGTLQWELTVIQQQKLDKAANLDLELITLANPQAGKIALSAGSVNLGVGDWFWVSNQRSENSSSLTLAPYSATSGALIIPANSPVQSIQDLAGKRLGIAGGAIDKNWLLLQTLASQSYKLDLDDDAKQSFGAPPILNQQLLNNRLDALLTYWHYAARLESQGFKTLLNGKQLLNALGFQQTIPTLGYVFSENWANENREQVIKFLKISYQAKNLICNSDQIWNSIAPLTRTENQQTQQLIRQRYCQGRISQWGDSEKLAASKIYRLITRHHSDLFSKKSEHLANGTFWDFDFSTLDNQN